VILEKAVIFQDITLSLKEFRFYSDYTHVNGLGYLPKAKRLTACSLKPGEKFPLEYGSKMNVV
jgi:hypothetical protein